jgi:hypothetical protein
MLQDFFAAPHTHFVAVRSSSEKGEMLQDFLRRAPATLRISKGFEDLALDALDPR